MAGWVGSEDIAPARFQLTPLFLTTLTHSLQSKVVLCVETMFGSSDMGPFNTEPLIQLLRMRSCPSALEFKSYQTCSVEMYSISKVVLGH